MNALPTSELQAGEGGIHSVAIKHVMTLHVFHSQIPMPLAESNNQIPQKHIPYLFFFFLAVHEQVIMLLAAKPWTLQTPEIFNWKGHFDYISACTPQTRLETLRALEMLDSVCSCVKSVDFVNNTFQKRSS